MLGRVILVAAAALGAGVTWAQTSAETRQAPSPAVLAEQAGRRFPQPVRAGDLAGRELLGPEESQPVLGRAVGVVRARDDGVSLVVAVGGWFGLGSHAVAVPIEAVALLGEHLALVGLKPDQLSASPFDPASATPLAPDETIRVGIVKPFH